MSRMNSTNHWAAFLIGGAIGVAMARLWGSDIGRRLIAMCREQMGRADEPRLDEALEESFPASDPPSWTPATSTPGVRP